jgi:hypothetical protein
MNILSIKQSNAKTKLIKAAGKVQDERIHEVGLSGIAHFLQHGDLTVLTGLSKAMPKSARGNALKFWITKHVKVKWNAKAYNGSGGFVKNGETTLSSWDKIAIIMQADLHPFYEKKDSEASQWNPETAILSLVKKLEGFKQEHELKLTAEAKQSLMQAIG